METSAAAAIAVRGELHAAGCLEDVSMVEIDAVDALRRLKRGEPPRLRQALVAVAVENAPRN